MSTVDPAEVAKFEKLAETWWDESGPFWPLHRLNRLRTGYILERVARHAGRDAAGARPLDGIRMLDIGCGGGLLSEAMADLGATVRGVDVVERNIRIAERHRGDRLPALTYATSTAESLVDNGETFDVVLNMEVVEHVADLPAFMAQCCRLVRPDGLMFVSTINRNPLSFLTAIVGAEYVLGWLPKGTHQWHRFPRPAELEALLIAGGLGVVDRRGVSVNPITRKFRLTSSLAVNYMLLAAPRRD